MVGGSPLVPSIRCSLGFSDQLGVGPVVSPTRVEGWGSGRFRHDKIPLCASQTQGGINDVRDKANYSTNTISCTHLDIVHSSQYV